MLCCSSMTTIFCRSAVGGLLRHIRTLLVKGYPLAASRPGPLHSDTFDPFPEQRLESSLGLSCDLRHEFNLPATLALLPGSNLRLNRTEEKAKPRHS